VCNVCDLCCVADVVVTFSRVPVHTLTVARDRRGGRRRAQRVDRRGVSVRVDALESGGAGCRHRTGALVWLLAKVDDRDMRARRRRTCRS
jgi:hypothetical protein